MIPTRYKCKFSRLMSYSIKAGHLSKELVDVPQFDNLSLAFFDSCQHPSRIENPCRVLRIAYSFQPGSLGTSHDLIEQGYCAPKWEIIVYPVPRDLVAALRAKLDLNGFEEIRLWFEQYKDLKNAIGHCWIEVLFDSDKETLTYEKFERL